MKILCKSSTIDEHYFAHYSYDSHNNIQPQVTLQ